MTRVALLTGAASGIGAACACSVAADGLAVAEIDRGGAPFLMDVTDEITVERVFDHRQRDRRQRRLTHAMIVNEKRSPGWIRLSCTS
jgi:NADP-dependent 3-hydroxy acid dehydrogenase YdfG